MDDIYSKRQQMVTGCFRSLQINSRSIVSIWCPDIAYIIQSQHMPHIICILSTSVGECAHMHLEGEEYPHAHEYLRNAHVHIHRQKAPKLRDTILYKRIFSLKCLAPTHH